MAMSPLAGNSRAFDDAHRLFVLYSWEDRLVADRLVSALRKRGFQVGLDREVIEPGDFIQDRVIQLIEDAETILFLISPDSISSPWCSWEVAAIQERDKRVVPVLLKSAPSDAIPEYLSHLNYVVMTDPNDGEAFETLIRVLNAGRGVSWSKRGNRVFLSYRRAESEHVAGRIYDHLEQKFGADQLFFDVEDVEFGDDFRESIKRALVDSRVLLAVAGRNWIRRKKWPLASVRPNEKDWVRVELEQAIELNVKIIPILADGAKMPESRELPSTLSQISYANAAPIRGGRDFRADISKVILKIEKLRQEPNLPVNKSATGEQQPFSRV